MQNEENEVRLEPQHLADLWGSGFVNRWHTHPHPGLRNSQDLTGAHSWRVAILVTMIAADNPKVSVSTVISDVMAALFHDTPECATGDLASPFKRDNPEIATRLEGHDARWLADRSVPAFVQSPLVKLCDRLDSYLFMLVQAPDLTHNPPWAKLRRQIMHDAMDQDCSTLVVRLIETIEARECF